MVARLANILLLLRQTLKGLFVLLVLSSATFYPNQTNASLGSFTSYLFTNTTEAANTPSNEPPVRTINSQNVALLLATVNSDLTSPPGGLQDINIVSNSALLSDSGPLGTIVDLEDSNPDVDAISLYIVREGDNLQKIAKMFDVSANTILWGNDLRSPKDIKVGQELVILPVSGIRYTIKQGDTIQGIAKRYGGDTDEILRFNNLEKGQRLTIGDEIIVPNGEFKPSTLNKRDSAVTKLIKTYINESVDSLAYYMRPIINGHRTQGLHGRNGVDIAPFCRCTGKEGLFAAAAGEVIVAKGSGWNGGFGNYVVISHPNGTQTLYGHMHSVTVHSGEKVSQGQQIGFVGSSGKSTGPHVHFEIRGARNPF